MDTNVSEWPQIEGETGWDFLEGKGRWAGWWERFLKERDMKDRHIKLGDEVVDEVTGVKGSVIAICEYLYGCRRVVVQPRVKKDENKVPEAQWIDEPQLKVTKKKKVKTRQGNSGGPLDLPRDSRKRP